jgi:hypothetical protein
MDGVCSTLKKESVARGRVCPSLSTNALNTEGGNVEERQAERSTKAVVYTAREDFFQNKSSDAIMTCASSKFSCV